MRYVTLIIGLLSLLSGCKDKDPVKIDFGYEYFPLSIGSAITYQVDSTIYNDFDASKTTFSLIRRDQVVEEFEDAEGRTVYRIERSERALDSTEFSLRKSFSLYRSKDRAERYKDNLRTVIMIFPIGSGARWNGNAFNTKSDEQFECTYVNQPDSYNELSFDSTLRIEQVNDTSNFITRDYAEERYAKGIGLIFRDEFHIVKKLNGDSGARVVQSILTYTK